MQGPLRFHSWLRQMVALTNAHPISYLYSLIKKNNRNVQYNWSPSSTTMKGWKALAESLHKGCTCNTRPQNLNALMFLGAEAGSQATFNHFPEHVISFKEGQK